MTTKVVPISTITKGSYIMMDGVACKVVGVDVSRPGKHGHAKYKITAIGLLDDRKRQEVLPGHDTVEVPIVDKRTAQVLSVTGTTAQVMDSETFETFEMEIPEELRDSIKEGVQVLYWQVLSDRVMKQLKG